MKNIFLSLGLFLLPLQALAEDSITAELEPNTITQEESVTLKITVKTEDSLGDARPVFKSPDFKLVHQYQSSSSQISIINGKMSKESAEVFHFVLQAEKTGLLAIQGVQISLNGKTLAAPDLKIAVETNGNRVQSPYATNSPSTGGGLRSAARPPRSTPVFLRAEVNRDKAYRGEPLVISYYLYSRALAVNAQAEKFPTLSGFLKEEIDMPILKGQMHEETVTMDGMVYKKILIARYQAFPLREGKLSVDEMSLKVQYTERQKDNVFDFDDEGSIFSQFFRNAPTRVAIAKNEPLAIEVQSVPTSGRPDHFTGVVGEIQSVSMLSQERVDTGKSFSYTIKVEGKANLSSLEKPELDLPAGVEVFDSHMQSSSGAGGLSQKIFDYSLVAKNPGNYKIKSLSFGYFNPQTKSFETTKTGELEFTAVGEAIAPTKGQNNSTEGVESQSPVSGDTNLNEGGIHATPARRSVWSGFELIQKVFVGVAILLTLFFAFLAFLRRGVPSLGRLFRRGNAWEQWRTRFLKGLALKSSSGSLDDLKTSLQQGLDVLSLQEVGEARENFQKILKENIEQIDRLRYGAPADAAALENIQNKLKKSLSSNNV